MKMTAQEVELLIRERDCWRTSSKFWRGLSELYEEHYICEDCFANGATALIGCTNPLHAIHTAVYEQRELGDL